MPERGILVVISGPSGVGKDTLVQKLASVLPNLRISLSVTTRKPRASEREGKDYHFVSPVEFQRMIEEEKFLEYARVFGDYYGTPKEALEELTKKGKDVVAVIDVQGAMQIKEKCPEAVLIFILPPSLGELERRLKKRGSDSEEAIKRRLEKANWEMSFLDKFHYSVVNDQLERAVNELRDIIIAEKSKIEKERD